MLFEEEYKDILDALTDPVFVVEAVHSSTGEIVDLQVVFYNKVYTQKTKKYVPIGGLYSKYIENKTLQIPPDYLTTTIRILNSGTPFTQDIFNTGSRTWINITLKKLDEEHLLGIIKDITSQKVQESYVGYIQDTDMLTGLPNRSTFYKNLNSSIETASKENALFGLYIIDIDDMKFINDFSGHTDGDTILKKCANILIKDESNSVKPYRLGDDEFVILKKAADSDTDLLEFAKKIYAQLMAEDIRTSIGISVFPSDDTHGNMLMKYADLAMRHVKRNGKCNYAFFQPYMYQQFLDHMQMKNKIITAMNQKEFELFYQPQYRLDSNKLRGFEALLRWHDKDDVWIAPAAFIPSAEKTNTIIQLGRWVLETAVATLKKWQTDYNFNGTMSINVSPVQLNAPGFLKDLCMIVNKYKLPPNTLELEITEGFLINDMKKAIGILSMIRKFGVYIALDDFGTGYSSLSYLNALPITTLKIDKTFIDKLSSESNVSTDIMSSIITILSTNGIETIAEGVERPEQLSLIHSLHFTNMQGFLSGKPMPFNSCELFVKEHSSFTEVPNTNNHL